MENEQIKTLIMAMREQLVAMKNDLSALLKTEIAANMHERKTIEFIIGSTDFAIENLTILYNRHFEE